MYILSHGELNYTVYNHVRKEEVVHDVNINSFIAEPVLWMAWTHRGSLTAVSNCQVFQVDASEFQRVARGFKYGGADDPGHYARYFVEEIRKLKHMNDVTDLFQIP
eukprot:CAMPEP_0180538096 /NCGR_PEP_ID=MMETSP1036_2-20121128/66166_1 /TAXON_ID=632150 /ORGANISM="Azadinium spinosum, Strain 3D9" /LENGTH=105 /DNA_ID=CAMNT_0022552733 /DNA_START=129 /DNA_END=443 /DNA_ORIENTATION=+